MSDWWRESSEMIWEEWRIIDIDIYMMIEEGWLLKKRRKTTMKTEEENDDRWYIYEDDFEGQWFW